LRVPPAALALLGFAIPGRGRKQVWFGFLSRYAFWLGARRGMSRRRWLQTTRGVPVLMYHAFTDGEDRERYVLPRRSFARQLRLLAALRYRVVSFEQLAQTLREGLPPPHRSVVLTVDDGYRDFELVQPLLERHRASATLFLVSRLLGRENEWTSRGEAARRPLLDVEQVRRVRAGGTLLGAHTRMHPSLPEIEDVRVEEEIEGSRKDLEELLGEPIRTFAYPYGRLDERAVAAVARAGFAAACTTESRLARLGDDPLLIPRIEIKGEDSIPTFLRKLWFGGG
jgi:peptidoglycan/xylan/chitin deacetylase (PgdA/CDA1 family)